MSVKYFDTEEELDDEFERIAETHHQYQMLKEELEEAERALEDAEKQLHDFEDDNREILFPR